MAVMLYALVVYQMRARSIRLRTGAPYDDRLGPVRSSSSLLPHITFSHSWTQYGGPGDDADDQTVLCLCLLGQSPLPAGPMPCGIRARE